MNTKPTILVIYDGYLPKAFSDGIAKSINGMIHNLCPDFDFRVLAVDRSLDDVHRPSDVQVGRWQPMQNGQVFYLPRLSLRSLFQLPTCLQAFNYDLVTLQGYFNLTTVMYLLLRRLGCLPKKPTIVAPHGSFGEGALALKSSLKKRVYIWMSSRLGFYDSVMWHASTENEMREIRRLYPHAKISVAANMSPPAEHFAETAQQTKPPKMVGQLRLVHLSRIDPKKQLRLALEYLAKVSGSVEFSIFGPVNVGYEYYWEQCKALIAQLPPNIQVTYHGYDPRENIAILMDHHMFFLPTSNENYGYAIVEALLAGCPVIISDRTPWRNLTTRQVGWDLPLDDENAFIEVLNTAIMMDDHTFQLWSKSAHDYGLSIVNDEAVVNANRLLFQQALSLHTHAMSKH